MGISHENPPSVSDDMPKTCEDMTYKDQTATGMIKSGEAISSHLPQLCGPSTYHGMQFSIRPLHYESTPSLSPITGLCIHLIVFFL